MSDTSALQTQGRWAWRALPVIALLTAVFIWDTHRVVLAAEAEARASLLHRLGPWHFVKTLTGTTVGR